MRELAIKVATVVGWVTAKKAAKKFEMVDPQLFFLIIQNFLEHLKLGTLTKFL